MTWAAGPAESEPAAPRPARRWRLRGAEIDLAGPAVMGVLNLTPDSFSDGGRVRDVEHALDVALGMVEEGAALVDVGGESTRPGAGDVPPDEQIRRVLPFLERAAGRLGVPLSVDTRSAEVARRALEAGAAAVNDVSALAHDPALAEVVASSGAGVVLMHMRGDPATMTARARYADVVEDVFAELDGAVARARGAGIVDEAVVLDPGFGFAKTAEQSTRLLGRLSRLLDLGFPVLVGPGRKSFLGALTGATVEDRVAGTLSACVVAYLQGARIFRVHDVKPVVQALSVAQAAVAAGSPAP
ncbi:MAG TPA: dihydropteroate synthase [Longimicrobiales bacterium]|nr:dihydropteroate synthase [Longimicrobiales bacterium]